MAEDEAAAAVWAMAHLVTPMAVRTAATLRLADHLDGGPRTADELADAAGADRDALRRLLRHLTRKGLFRRDETGRYEVTALGRALRQDHPSGVREVLDGDGAVGRAELSFVHLLHSVRTGEAAFPQLFGTTFWEDLAADPARSDTFDRRMGTDMAVRVPDILAAFDWGSLGHVTDVGGGDGSLLISLLGAFPDLCGTVVDLPATAGTAARRLARAGLSDRADAVGGSFFDPLPVRPGAYLLSSVLHDWAAEPATRILRRCAEAVQSGGRVLVVERNGADGESPHPAMDLRMLAYYGGRERGTAELVALAERAGLRATAVHPAGILSVLELAAA